MLELGETAPSFTLPGTDGETIDEYSLKEYTNEGAAVLAFYPFDFSPICTEELCDFRDVEWLTFTEGVNLFGISTDSAYSHRAFINEHDLTFPLLSDSLAEVCEEYGVRYDIWEQHQNVSQRALFVIDDTQTVQYAWMTEDALVKPDLSEVQDAMKSVDVFDS